MNYDPFEAFNLLRACKAQFVKSSSAGTLPQDLGTQFQVSKALLLLAADMATRVGLRTDVFEPDYRERAHAIKECVFETRPSDLSKEAERQRLTV